MTEDEVMAWLTELVVAPRSRGPVAHDVACRLFAALGDPQDTIPSVHVVGTAGKGTFAALLSARLVDAGVRVVTHMSPHVHDVRERWLVDGRMPSWADVGTAAEPVIAAAASVQRETGHTPTFFAGAAAIAWQLAAQCGAELAVVEAGIGGRHDATNVARRPDVITVVTAIGLDHSEVLGATTAQIAAEKAAVVEGRVDTVLGPQPDSAAAAVVEAAVLADGGTMHRVGPADGWVAAAAATVETALALVAARLGRPLSTDPVEIRLPPGRMETVMVAGRRVVLDGAHNPMKLAALAGSWPPEPAPRVVIAAVGARKDLTGCADVIASMGGLVVATGFGSPEAPGPRSHPPAALAAAVGAHRDVVIAGRAAEAARLALDHTVAGDTILVTGSFLHLAEVREALSRG